jgi:hypothetical protein
MAEFGWPNSAAPALAPFRLDVPDDWTAMEARGALLALLAPEHDRFRANVVVFGERLPADVAVDEVAEAAAGADVAESIAGTQRASSETELAIAVRRSSRVVEDRTINQLVVSTEAEDRSAAGFRSVYTLVGTFLADRLEEDEPVLKGIVSSFTVPVSR